MASDSDSSVYTNFVRWAAGLATAGRPPRISVATPTQEEAREKLEAWRASRRQGERDEIVALERGLKKESPA